MFLGYVRRQAKLRLRTLNKVEQSNVPPSGGSRRRNTQSKLKVSDQPRGTSGTPYV